jgi:hypothetical protein
VVYHVFCCGSQPEVFSQPGYPHILAASEDVHPAGSCVMKGEQSRCCLRSRYGMHVEQSTFEHSHSQEEEVGGHPSSAMIIITRPSRHERVALMLRKLWLAGRIVHVIDIDVHVKAAKPAMMSPRLFVRLFLSPALVPGQLDQTITCLPLVHTWACFVPFQTQASLNV